MKKKTKTNKPKTNFTKGEMKKMARILKDGLPTRAKTPKRARTFTADPKVFARPAVMKRRKPSTFMKGLTRLITGCLLGVATIISTILVFTSTGGANYDILFCVWCLCLVTFMERFGS